VKKLISQELDETRKCELAVPAMNLFVASLFWEVENLYHFFGHSKASREDLYSETTNDVFHEFVWRREDSKGLS
jgi:hypothetical protein